MDEFGGALKKLREEKQVDTREVARAVGIPQSRYSELERGIRVPTGGQLTRLEEYYGTARGYLADLAEQDFKRLVESKAA